MAVNEEKYNAIIGELAGKAILVAVSKTKPAADILELYNLGQRHFGENYVQELVDKQAQLPNDIYWHFIGHLQSNKVKQLAPFVQLIHGVDSLKLLQEINKQAGKQNRVMEVLLQVHIAKEDTKFGLNEEELDHVLNKNQLAALSNICVKGLMGMASFTSDISIIQAEFHQLQSLFNRYAQSPLSNLQFHFLSMGMSGDYKIALQEGSTMIRIGSLLFGARAAATQ